MASTAKLGLLATFFMGATPATANGVFEVVTMHPELEIVGVLVLLTSVTALTFILVLLACGMRDPIL